MFFSQELIRGLREVFVFDVILCPKLRLIFKLFVTLTMHMCHHAALIFAASKQPSHSLSLQSVISFLLRPRGLIRTSVFPSASAWHTSNAVISLTPTWKRQRWVQPIQITDRRRKASLCECKTVTKKTKCEHQGWEKDIKHSVTGGEPAASWLRDKTAEACILIVSAGDNSTNVL